MNGYAIAFVVSILLSIVTVIGDIFIKNASDKPGFSGWVGLTIGALIFGATALGWFFVLRKIELSNTAVIYSVSCVLMLTVIGVVYYHERISIGEMVGIGTGMLSLFLLYRFA